MTWLPLLQRSQACCWNPPLQVAAEKSGAGFSGMSTQIRVPEGKSVAISLLAPIANICLDGAMRGDFAEPMVQATELFRGARATPRGGDDLAWDWRRNWRQGWDVEQPASITSPSATPVTQLLERPLVVFAGHRLSARLPPA